MVRDLRTERAREKAQLFLLVFVRVYELGVM
jgi:hypothetical protein